MKFYLAYGSNLNKAQMNRRCPGAVSLGTTTVKDYRLDFRRGYLTIEKQKGAETPVGVWMITEANEVALDRYEGFPDFYYKQELTVDLFGKPIKAMAYMMHPIFPREKPSEFYMDTVRRGYEDFGIKEDPLIYAYMRAAG